MNGSVIEVPEYTDYGRNFLISSFCTVATKEVKREVHFLSMCLSRFYSAPLVVYCDQETYNYITDKSLGNVIPYVVDFKEPEKVIKRNNYHKSCAISAKMDVMEHCTITYGNTMFLDCDIIPLYPFNGPADCEVALSLNLAEESDSLSAIINDGIFNAGMVWTRNAQFPIWWKDQYLNNEKDFYEQTALNRVPAKFRVGYFANEHNYGFWRGVLGNRNISSFHCHLDTTLDESMNKWVQARVWRLRGECMNHIRIKNKKVMEFYKEVFL